MKTINTWLRVSVIVLSLLAITQPSKAIPVTIYFSQDGWPSGGEVTGTFVIDTDHDSITPGVEYIEAVSSFSAHWSGNAYSQPFDWDLSNLNGAMFGYDVERRQIFDLVLGRFVGDPNCPVYYDMSIGLIWDLRPSAIDYIETYGRYRTDNGLDTFVPDNSNTMLLLGASLAGIVLLRLKSKPASSITTDSRE